MKAWHVILIFAFYGISFWGGYKYKGLIDNSVSAKTDTIIRIDTLIERFPEPVKEVVTKYVSLPPDTVIKYMKGDTIYIPVSQKEYLTSDYHAWVSGYNAALDSINVFPKTMYITKRIPARRWGLGVTAGYGVGKHGLSPYVGIGGYYRIW